MAVLANLLNKENAFRTASVVNVIAACKEIKINKVDTKAHAEALDAGGESVLKAQRWSSSMGRRPVQEKRAGFSMLLPLALGKLNVCFALSQSMPCHFCSAKNHPYASEHETGT